MFPYYSSKKNNTSTLRVTCPSPKPGHQRAQDLSGRRSFGKPTNLYFSSLPTHRSPPFIEGWIGKHRVRTVPRNPAHTRKRPASHSSNRPKYGSLVISMATSGEPSTWFPLGQLVEQERLSKTFSQVFEILQTFRNVFGTT